MHALILLFPHNNFCFPFKGIPCHDSLTVSCPPVHGHHDFCLHVPLSWLPLQDHAESHFLVNIFSFPAFPFFYCLGKLFPGWIQSLAFLMLAPELLNFAGQNSTGLGMGFALGWWPPASVVFQGSMEILASVSSWFPRCRFHSFSFLNYMPSFSPQPETAIILC